MYLPRHLCRHESLTEAERAYLDGMDLPSRPVHDRYATLAEAVLASRVDGYHADGSATHWKPEALKIYTATAKEGEGLSAQAVADGAAYLRDCQKPTQALSLLMRVDELQRQWRLERAMRLVTTADKLLTRPNSSSLAA